MSEPTITFSEARDSRKWTSGAMELRLIATGSADDVTIRNAVVDYAVSTWDGGNLVLSSNFTLEPLTVDETAGSGTWLVTLRYELAKYAAYPAGARILTADISAGTQHIVLAKHQRITVKGDNTPIVDANLIIGARDDGGVDGVDIQVPVFTFEIEATYLVGDQPSMSDLYAVACHTNDAQITFTDTVVGDAISLAKGECFCRGTRRNRPRGDGCIVYNHQFVGVPNLSDYAIPSGDGVFTFEIDKGGHEYLWMHTRREAVDGEMTTIIHWIGVAQVYDEADFGRLKVT